MIAFSIAIAPIIGWGRYETFEYGCTLAFHDPSLNFRSYVLFTMVVILAVPLGATGYCYIRIIWFTYQCKLDLFAVAVEREEEEETEDHCVNFKPDDPSRSDSILGPVESKLMEAVSLVERKFTRLTLVAALGFMVAWLPFSLLCMWELATPPDEIPIGKIPSDRERRCMEHELW